MKKPFDPNAPYQPESFSFRDREVLDDIFSRYPQGRERSAIMPLLDLVQRQTAEDGLKTRPPQGGWIPRAAMDEIARLVDQPPVKVYEVATFYSMYNLAPIGVHHVQCCTTTPCWLQGSEAIVKACEEELRLHMGETSADGKFTLSEVECLGACVNAPMVQINDDYYEDLTPETMKQVLKSLKKGQQPEIGPQSTRHASEPLPGPTTLQDRTQKAG
ncbi:MAG: NADH-quinone oxidoreductase subunit NuoE [Alphaproteobacteria bacterium]|nr:NADH-quinone oxidoreductase subunit NuoE [Alphaproteobacteria bacterium]